MSSSDPKPYHHGDLRRALIDAARHILETEGPEALSLRAVAREAGVSPAAPYHHFKDKNELLEAVADQGFDELADDLAMAFADGQKGRETLTRLGAAYAGFALSKRALYRVMVGAARTRERLPAVIDGQAKVVRIMQDTIRLISPPGISEEELDLAGVTAWATIHGLIEISTFRLMEPLKAELGGERAFLHAVMGHLDVFSREADD